MTLRREHVSEQSRLEIQAALLERALVELSEETDRFWQHGKVEGARFVAQFLRILVDEHTAATGRLLARRAELEEQWP